MKENLKKVKEYKSLIEYENNDGFHIFVCKGCGKKFNSTRSGNVHAGQCKIYQNNFVENYERFRSDVEKYCIEQNLYVVDVCKILKLDRHFLYKIMEVLNLNKSQDLKNEIEMKRYKDRSNKYKSKTGYDIPFKDPKIRSKIKETCMERYGVPYNCMTEQCRFSNTYTISRPNKAFAEYLRNDFNINSEFEFHIGRYSYDLYIPELKILIEINPTYTHNSTIGPKFRDGHVAGPQSSDYHLNKTELAIQNGYRCIHVFDWDYWSKIIYTINPNKTKIYARNCKIKEVSVKDCNEFLNNYHLQGTCRNQNVRLGLYYDNKLIQLMTFGKPRYNKNYQWELLRLCSHKNYSITGGSQRLFKYFINNYNPESIISYCDRSKFEGNVYDKLGFKLKNQTGPAINWSKGYNKITDNLLRQRGADQLIGTSDGKGTSNREIMIREGWVEVYDCGQNVYEWICQ